MTHANGATVTATLVVLRSSVWQAELVMELERLGIDPAKAPAAAAHALHRIVGHHGWPKGVIQVASSDGAAEAHEVPLSERPGEGTASPR